jgi:hypothetical protein
MHSAFKNHSIQLQTPSATPTFTGTLTSATSTLQAGPALNAAGRVQPYRPLLVPGSILLTAVILILRL